jgi:hypothetical protein
VRFATDKVTLGYLPVYLGIAARLGTAAVVCEIGVHDGASLDMWQALFPGGVIAGVDCNPDARWPGGTRRIVAGQDDGNLPALLAAAGAGTPDLVIDDASHDGILTRRTWDLLWPLVRPGGWYVIEDWMVGFGSWPGHDTSMRELAGDLLSLLDGGSDAESVCYRYGMIIIRKKG